MGIGRLVEGLTTYLTSLDVVAAAPCEVQFSPPALLYCSVYNKRQECPSIEQSIMVLFDLCVTWPGRSGPFVLRAVWYAMLLQGVDRKLSSCGG